MLLVWIYACVCAVLQRQYFSHYEIQVFRNSGWFVCSQKCLGLSIKYRNEVHQGPLSSSCITSSLSDWNYNRNWHLLCKLLMLLDFWPQLHWGSKTEWSLRCLSWETFTSYSIRQPCLDSYADPVSSFTTTVACRIMDPQWQGLTTTYQSTKTREWVLWAVMYARTL